MGPNIISDIEYKLTEYKSYQIQKKKPTIQDGLKQQLKDGDQAIIY